MRTDRRRRRDQAPVHHARRGQVRRPVRRASSLGDTHVLCTATVADGVPAWLRGAGRGLAHGRVQHAARRHAYAHSARGRARPAVRAHHGDPAADRPQPAGRDRSRQRRRAHHHHRLRRAAGRRRARARRASRGAYVALHQAVHVLQVNVGLRELPLFDSIAAVSVGVVDGRILLDLDYEEDSAAEVDMNVVLTGDGRLVEVQATAEGEPFERATLDELLEAAAAGAAAIAAAQAAAVARLGYALRPRHRQPAQARRVRAPSLRRTRCCPCRRVSRCLPRASSRSRRTRA